MHEFGCVTIAKSSSPLQATKPLTFTIHAHQRNLPMVPLVLGLEGDPPHGSENVAAGAHGSVVCLAARDGLEDQGSLFCTPPAVVAPLKIKALYDCKEKSVST